MSSLSSTWPAGGRGGYELHINCVGQGSPAVILESALEKQFVAGGRAEGGAHYCVTVTDVSTPREAP